MWKLLMRKRSLPIALDMGASGVRMLQLRSAGGGLAAWASGRWRCPAPAGGEGADTPERRAMIVAAVRELLKTGGFVGRRAVTSLSATHLHIKNVRLPNLSEEELRQAVLWEAKERFGFEVSPDQLSYLNAGSVRQGDETRNEIIMMAASPETVNGHLAMLEEMGLRPEHIDAEPLAMFRSFERFLRRAADGQAVSVIVDLGLAGTRVVVARGRHIVFIKFIDIGGRRLNDAVAKQLNLSPAEAAELRVRVMRESEEAAGRSPSAENDAPAGLSATALAVRDAVRAEVEALAREVALCLRYCSVTFRGLRPQRVTLIGGEAYDPAVRELLTEHLGIECVVGQPFRGIDTSGVDLGGDRRGVLADWGVCAGLAVHGAEGPALAQVPDADEEADRLTA